MCSLQASLAQASFKKALAGQSLVSKPAQAKSSRSALSVQSAIATQRLKDRAKFGTQKIGAPKPKKTGTQPINRAPSVGTQVKKVGQIYC